MTTRFSSSGLRSQYQVPPMSSVGGPSASEQPPLSQPQPFHQRESAPARASRVASRRPLTATADSNTNAAAVATCPLVSLSFTVLPSTTKQSRPGGHNRHAARPAQDTDSIDRPVPCQSVQLLIPLEPPADQPLQSACLRPLSGGPRHTA